MLRRLLPRLVAALVLAAAGCASPTDMGPAPPFTLPSVEGGSFSLSELRGRSPVVVNFFATWCSPCREELPQMIALYRKYQARGLRVVAVSQESVETLRGFKATLGIPYPILSDPKGIAFRPYGASVIPRTALIDRDGNLVAIMPGFDEKVYTGKFLPMLEKLLGPPQNARRMRDPDGFLTPEARRHGERHTEKGVVGAPLVGALPLVIVPEGTHEGCPYGTSFRLAKSTMANPDCRGVFGSPQPLWDRGVTLRDVGIDAVFVGHGALSDALITRCHQEGARVYAEFGVFQGKKVAEARPELWPIGADGKRLAPEEWYLGLCPNQPAYRKEKLAELGDLARKFAVDGVWLDFIRFPCHWEVREPRLQQACFCDASLDQFARAAHLTLPAGTTAERAGWILREHGDSWTRWKCSRIAAFVRDARRALKAARPQALLGIFAVPWTAEERGGAIRSIIGQDFRRLARDVDVFSPMTYHRMVGRPVSWTAGVAAGMRAATGKRVWPILQAVDAPPGEDLPAAELSATLRQALARDGGAVLFTLAAVLERPEKQAAMTQAFLEHPALAGS
jgi:peroxiredoxin